MKITDMHTSTPVVHVPHESADLLFDHTVESFLCNAEILLSMMNDEAIEPEALLGNQYPVMQLSTLIDSTRAAQAEYRFKRSIQNQARRDLDESKAFAINLRDDLISSLALCFFSDDERLRHLIDLTAHNEEEDIIPDLYELAEIGRTHYERIKKNRVDMGRFTLAETLSCTMAQFHCDATIDITPERERRNLLVQELSEIMEQIGTTQLCYESMS